MSGRRWVEKTGRTVEEAVQAALDDLGTSREQVEVQVLDEPNRGLWGFIGGRMARVRVTLREPAAAGSEAREHPSGDRGEPDGEDAPPRARGEGARGGALPAAAPPPEVVQAKLARGKAFLQEVARLLGVTGQVETRRVEADLYTLNLVGDNPARLIGRHGQTLDAVQYLLNIAANRAVPGPWVRFVVDSGDYRRRREVALRALAQRIARQVRRAGRSVALEPMNPLERRVNHLALKDDPSVSTASEGEEPHRRVVVRPRQELPGGSRPQPGGGRLGR